MAFWDTHEAESSNASHSVLKSRRCAAPLGLVEQVQGRAQFEPSNLTRPKQVDKLQRFGRAIGVVQETCHRLPGSKVLQPDQAHSIILLRLVIVIWIAERQCQKSLLLQVGLVDARKTPGDDGCTTK